jgi:two-component system, chemotaxis family, response regulator Rcp1
MKMDEIQLVDILVVEDNPGDARLITEILKKDKLLNLKSLHIVKDGIEAMDYLYRKNGYGEVPRPDLILLDLNLPRKDGREVLSEIKNNDILKRIPVIIMTTSQAHEDIIRSYNLHANGYISKPIELEQFARVVRAIEDFWFSIVKLPPKD